ncbi:MAG: caspase family protein [Desulfocucumaceae bacterium]
MRKALVVGINYYRSVSNLYGCVNDANSVKNILERNSDGTVNFAIKYLSSDGPDNPISRLELKEAIRELFADDIDTALFYYSGHGYIETTGGYLITTECKYGDDGVSLGEVLILANKSKARDKIIILDSCFSGIAGSNPTDTHISQLSEGLTILTASTDNQYATEQNSSGLFTTLLVDALNGAAANIVGDITPGSVYAHIDQSLGPWKQRPVFKTNIKHFVSLRKVQPSITLEELHNIIKLFPEPGYQFRLDPSFEPESENPNIGNTLKFAILQKYNRVNLLVPVDAPHMWHAAMGSKTCKLTVLGEHYRRLVESALI